MNASVEFCWSIMFDANSVVENAIYLLCVLQDCITSSYLVSFHLYSIFVDGALVFEGV